jgi:hypothetical protein
MTALNRAGQVTEGTAGRRIRGVHRAWLGRAAFALVFVAVWSSGFLVGSIGTRTVTPGTLGFWRFLAASAVLGVIAVAGHGRWPLRPATWVHLIVTGFLLVTAWVPLAAFKDREQPHRRSRRAPAGLAAVVAGKPREPRAVHDTQLRHARTTPPAATPWGGNRWPN